MSRRGRKRKAAAEPPRPAWPESATAPWPVELARTVARIVGGRLLFLAGMALVGLGGALLASAWRLGPESLLELRGRSALSGRAEVRAVDPFWRIAVEREPIGRELAWPHRASAELCADLVADGGGAPRTWTLCGARRRGPGAWNLIDGWELAPGAPIVWPRDLSGWPVVELRVEPEALAWLRARPAGFWPLLGQSEEARALAPPPGSEWDAFWLEIDRPLEWLVRSAPAPEEARFELAFDPAAPARALPAGLLGGPASEPLPLPAILVLAAGGGLAWWQGVRFAFGALRRPVLLAVAVVPLLLLPWWGDRFAEAVRRLAPGFGDFGLALAADLAEAGRPPVEVRDGARTAPFERVVWRIESSYYRDRLAPFEPLVTTAPGDPDRALEAAAVAIRSRLLDYDAETQAAILQGLAWEEQLDRGQVGLLFAPAALLLLEDPAAPEPVRAWAASFLFWLGVTPLGIHPEQPAFAARRSIWEALHGASDPAVRNTAGFVLERLPPQEPAPAAEPGTESGPV